ncbi:MAG: hypothetical protein KIT84_08435 [Labilithrix sp.]|nr:hypothetical protein [Labilithrix sp.]MCW5811025.1 hypothetical protein [Labilithrix sp.]
MPKTDKPKFTRLRLDDLTIEDEKSFRHIGLYADLKEVLRRANYGFRALPESAASWDRALFLNLTFWGAAEGGDVLVDANVPADVVAHVAWHHLAAKALMAPGAKRPPVDALFLGEAIASAFDLYLVGRTLGHAPKSTFLATQVEAMAETASAAGLDEDAFERLLEGVAGDPEEAFARLRELLTDATSALFACNDAESALGVLAELESHRFGPLLYRYELANWVLYARAYGDPEPSPRTREIERALRAAKDPLAWLEERWVKG